jgi:chromosome condensin MukBEF MukE localization factor
VVGWIDWLTIPGEHPARTPATIHGVINTAGIVALIGASTVPKRRLGLLGAATAGLLVAAWIGGDLVFRFGWRVRPAEEAEIAESALVAAGQAQPFEQARQEVADFERRKTFLPA